MSLTTLIPPATEPVSLDEAKQFLRIDQEHENDLIAHFIAAARELVETKTHLALVSRRVLFEADLTALDRVTLPALPVAAIIKVELHHETDPSIVLPSTAYSLTQATLLVAGAPSWQNYLSGASRISAEYDLGYGPDSADVPASLRQAILLIAAQFYEHRGDKADEELPLMAKALLAPFMEPRL